MIWIVFAVLGAAAGALLPQAAERMAAWKMEKKGKTLESAPAYTAQLTRALCIAANALGWGLCAYFGSIAAALLSAALWSCGVVLILLDLRLRIIPNELLLAMLVLGLPLQVLQQGFGGLPRAVFSMLVIMMVYMSLGNFMGLYKIGAGDVKLSAVMALVLGYPYIMWAMLAMALSMLLFCGVGIALRKMTLKSMLPFGPFLVPGFWVGLVLLLAA